jgi:hypothetical protein
VIRGSPIGDEFDRDRVFGISRALLDDAKTAGADPMTVSRPRA